MEQKERRYPIGIQTFSEIIKGNYLYVDKTGLMYDMVRNNKYIFLSRPRRFGKSLLTSTLHSYFAGQRELFNGLAIEKLEQDWTEYPVLHFDLSTVKNVPTELIPAKINTLLSGYETLYGRNEVEQTPGDRLGGLIKRACVQTGSPVVVLIDEYDAPLLDVLHTTKKLTSVRRLMQEFFTPLKACDAFLKFVFITGITKFSQLSIFSTINNLTNISMQPRYSALCGITEEELYAVFKEDIAALARECQCTEDEMKSRLKSYYDGYHFSRQSADLYNPFSLFQAFHQKEISTFWFESATPSYLFRQMEHFHTDITKLDDVEAPASAFDRPTEALTDALPLLYQSGYITIKGYDEMWRMYRLGIPNTEVRVGLMESLLPLITSRGNSENGTMVQQFCRALYNEDLNEALTVLKAYMAGIPYPETGKELFAKLANKEAFYEILFYVVFSCMNSYVQTQVKTLSGRIDVVMHTPHTIYIFELKVNGSAQDALKQIETNGYLIPYSADKRKLVKIGIVFDTQKRTIKDWTIKAEKQ